ncbi:MAG: DNA repair protein RadA [Patescibacteria group bacterium]|nr:DNA repair protein RadA [Patescibacteria group bacterium]MDD5490274.1 DNA repair protein RadA [Patescibacteria group bacterium]
MPKSFLIYECSKCGAQTPKWGGRCLECGAWGTLEQVATTTTKEEKKSLAVAGKTVKFSEINHLQFPRIKTSLEEFDAVVGGGIVPGSLTLLGGEPGIGKSTLILQIAAKVSDTRNVLYVSGEESGEQIKLRLERLKLSGKNISFLGETDVNAIVATLEKEKPILAIIDSIQTIYSPDIPSEAGSISQVRASTVRLLETAKKNNIPVFIIGHVTKEGLVAGPKTLEHLVDTVIYLEGERYQSYRLLRTVKNRFGSAGEVGVFEMTGGGMEEVKNPSLIFLQNKNTPSPGSAITCILEGSRPLLVEIQALVNRTNFGYPQRKSEGFNPNRLQVLIAVLTQRAKINLNASDVYLNVAGGLKIQEPAADLAVALAIASAAKNKGLDANTVILGEIGLGGEIRGINQLERRLKEIEKLGFKTVILPKLSQKITTKLKLIEATSLFQALELL